MLNPELCLDLEREDIVLINLICFFIYFRNKFHRLMENNKLEELLKSNSGLLTVNCKLPVKDRTSLALVYTPGVGASCKLIQKNPIRAYDLTNKLNTMLVVTDSSSIPGIKISENSLIGYPFIEAICVYYKSIANIDAYPIIIDFKQTKSHQDFKDTVNAIMPAFSCVEFFGVDKERVADFNSNNLFSFMNLKKE
jgi:malic enzyme